MSQRDVSQRALVPVARRRRHLVLLSAGGDGYSIRAVVRKDDFAALQPFVDRLLGNGVSLRLADAEDGFFDAGLLWRAGRRIEW